MDGTKPAGQAVCLPSAHPRRHTGTHAHMYMHRCIHVLVCTHVRAYISTRAYIHACTLTQGSRQWWNKRDLEPLVTQSAMERGLGRWPELVISTEACVQQSHWVAGTSGTEMQAVLSA